VSGVQTCALPILDEASRAAIAARLPTRPLYWTQQGQLPLAQLPGFAAGAETAADVDLPTAPAAPGQLWRDPHTPICRVQQQAEGWSIGWRWHPSQRFGVLRVRQWLAQLAWRRAKLVLHCEAGWRSANLLREAQGDEGARHWRDSEWRADSRLELIFDQAQDVEALSAAFAACRIPGVG